MKFRDVDVLMNGEAQKAVWSLYKQYKKMRVGEVAKKIGREPSNVTPIINKLIGYKVLEKTLVDGKEINGLYNLKKGVTK